MDALAADLVVVGAGAAGLLAAAVAREEGLDVVVLEATDLVGGSTASDTGQVWLPATHWSGRVGKADTPEAALTYLDAILGEPTAASSRARREAFVTTAGPLARWLESRKVGLAALRGRPDFHQGAEEARRAGRVVACGPQSRRVLGEWAPRLRPTAYTVEIAPRSLRGVVAAAQMLVGTALAPSRDTVTGGAALATQLLRAALDAGADVRTGARMLDLVSESGRVVGVRATLDGAPATIAARRGVLLACGGFEGSAAMRRRYLPRPTDPAWTTGLASNTGDGINAAARLGAPLSTMDEAWWTLVALFHGTAYRMTNERSLPFGVIVDSAGDRFINEAGPTPEIGRHVYSHHAAVRSIPAYLVVDNRHRIRYRMGPWLPGSSPGGDEEIASSDSVTGLAERLGISQAGLIGTLAQFNGPAAKGTDPDFRRGRSAADRANGDPGHRRNPSLGTIEKAPFWAVPLYPGDSGTKGGVLVDADARVLRGDGTPIEGLFATGGTAASLFKATAPGSGASLGSALVDAYRAARAASGRGDEGAPA